MSSLIPMGLPPSKLRKAIIRCMLSGLVPIVTSSPAIGKSDIIRSIAKEYRMKLIDLRVPQCDVTDFNGLPFATSEGKAAFLPFDTFPLKDDPLPDHPDGGKYEGWILFLDELTSAPKHLQAPAYKLILDRLIGNHDLHPNVLMVAAGNLASDKAIVFEMSTALQSRLIHLELALDHAEWTDWAIQNNVDSRVISFLQFKPEMLYTFDPAKDEKTFAAPRTWNFVSKLTKNKPVEQDDLPLLAGAISPGPAQEFISFVQIFSDLPKISDIIAHPTTIAVPQDPSIKFALATVLAEKMDDNNVSELGKFLERMPIEARVICLRLLRQRNPSLIRHKAIQDVFAPILARM